MEPILNLILLVFSGLLAGALGRLAVPGPDRGDWRRGGMYGRVGGGTFGR